MGYILKKSSAGGGDANAVNQQTQIDQIDSFSSVPSVFKDQTANSVFIDAIDNSVFKDSSGDSIINKSNIVTGNYTCEIVTGGTLVALQSNIQSLLNSRVGYYLISFTYADTGVAPAPHSAVIIFAPQ